MKKIRAALLGAGMLWVCHAPSYAAASADGSFKEIYTQEWQWRKSQDLDPYRLQGTSLPRVDAAAQQQRLAYWRAVQARLDALDSGSLSAPQQINYAVYRAQIRDLIAAQQFREYEKPLNADSAFWTDLSYLARQSFRQAADYRNYIARLNDVPRYFREQIVNMRAGLRRGFTPPQVTLAGRDVALSAVADAASPEATIFYQPFQHLPEGMPPEQQRQLREQGAAAIRNAVMPAYGALLAFMRGEYLPHAATALAAESLPDGKAYYQSKIVEFTTTDVSAEWIHRLGLSEMANLRLEMDAAIRQTGFKGDFPAFLAFLRTDPRFYARTPEELLMRAAFIAKKFDARADQYFGHLPRRRFGIVPVPPEQAPFYTSGRGGPGIYLVNTYNLASRPLYSLPALTLHESAPGHAFQIPLAMEQKDRPAFRNAYISAYGEGWALYAERLGAEMGIYADAYETFGMLSYQAWRAARLVVDTGIHAQGWSREQAQAYLHDNTALSAHEIETEVDRYISWPGQALSYYLGELAIINARRKAELVLGERFDIRAFHDTVLELGSVPLPVLEKRIEAFITEGGKGPYPESAVED
ncbi:DUF885 domain-containing protein [Janthinobacterium agaricidamnosum]|uniref:DUF885 family protein n=1 Tax=Janthinobacterium agaricidamnosum NBRC 102515 = DSM 9628 TaxID=1349767 RepID=W0V3V8_9BURK|nr:DUF885 family protein [Janthinobacterium agaricidamnosum]CDG83509.1 conserved hypothetical protein [Janthinobacterium agaricidamnosum NBRC 102515 = DSM 9628]